LLTGWSVDDEATAQSDDAVQLQQPDMLISVLAPTRSARQFSGRAHLLIGRYLPADLARKYDLALPEFAGTDVFVELRPGADQHHAKKDGAPTEDGPAAKGKNGADSSHYFY